MVEGTVSSTVAAPFDAVAGGYDAEFSDTVAGRWLRETVWSKIAPFARSGVTILDLGCGTGEDAVWLAQRGCHVTAADSSEVMLTIVAAKFVRCGLTDQVTTIAVDINAAENLTLEFQAPFDLVLSNFGAANCVEDIGAFGRRLRRWVKPDGAIALTVMGRFSAWEFVWYLLHFDSRALRRWRGKATASIGGRPMNVRYWGVRDLRRAMGPAFRLVAVHAIGILLPPSYLFHLVERSPRLFRVLARWDRWVSTLWPFSRMGDHMLVLFQHDNEAEIMGRRP